MGRGTRRWAAFVRRLLPVGRPTLRAPRVHLVGIGGDGMSALARLYLDAGWQVSGSDRVASPGTVALQALGAEVHIGHAPHRVAGAGLVVASAAVPRRDPELDAARAAGIPVQIRSEALTRLLAGRDLVCVAGSHGKTTTTTMLSLLLDAAGRVPGFMLGGASAALGGVTGRLGQGPFVSETCEAFRALDYWQPRHLLVTNVDDEHGDHYGGRAQLERAFAGLVARTPADGRLVLCGDDPWLASLAASSAGHACTYGLDGSCDVGAVEVEHAPQGTRFGLLLRGQHAGRFMLPVPGRHNLQNALGALAMALALGVDGPTAAAALSRFQPVARRWTALGAERGVRVFDDFAHHPAEIRATLALARQCADGGRVVAVLRPQLVSRVTRLADDYAAALTAAELAFVLPVDAAGEAGDAVQAGVVLQRALAKRHAACIAIPEGTTGAAQIAPLLRAGDVVVGLGPSAVLRVTEALLAALRNPEAAGSPDSGAACATPAPGPEPAPTALARTALLHAAFEHHAALHPDAACAYEGDQAWTYGRLDAEANRVAAALRARGVGVDDLVVLHMDKSLQLLALMLGVLKAGAAFVPVDPAMARLGLGDTLRRAGAVLAISDRVGDAAAHDILADAVGLDDFLSSLPACADAVPCAATPASLAYAMFTSGSSGAPRLVGVEHRNVAHVIACSVRDVYQPGDFRLVPLLASIGFDASIQQAFAPLSAGGRLLVAADLPGLLRSPRYGGITMMGMTPSQLRVVLDTAALPQALRTLVLGGEPTPGDLLQRLRRQPGLRVRNVYGPTETTIYSMTGLFQGGDPALVGNAAGEDDGWIIGTPIAGMHVHLLDPDGHEAGNGESGELLLAGPAVARGYLGEPERTAQAFVDDPCGSGRAYRTGDLARRLPDGRYRYLGRVDDQMKIHGVRLDPSEVEALLESCPGVAAAAAVKVVDQAGSARLLAFVVPHGALDAAGLRQWLRPRAPAMLVPADIVMVAALPRLVSGKVDRQALARGWREARPEAPTVDHHGDDAALMLDCWRTALRNPALRDTDDFFEHGGDSLTLMQLVLAVERQFGVRLPAQQVQEATTAAAMLAALEGQRGDAQGARATGGGADPDPDPGMECLDAILARQRTYLAAWQGVRAGPQSLVVRHNAEGSLPPLAWCFQGHHELERLARHLGPDQPVAGMRSGHLVMRYGAGTIAGLADAYADELDALQPRGAFRLGGNCQGATIARALALALRARGRTVERLVLMEPSRFWFYDEPVDLVFGRDSSLNPLRHGPLPERELAAAYPAGHRIHFIDGGHGEFFSPRNVLSLATVLAGILGRPSGDSAPMLDHAVVAPVLAPDARA